MTQDSTKLDLSALFLIAQRDGKVRIFGPSQLQAFADHVAAQGEVIRNVEAYEMRGELEIPRIDLGLYQGTADDADRPSAVRLAASQLRLGEVVDDAVAEGRQFVFDVWTDENG